MSYENLHDHLAYIIVNLTHLYTINAQLYSQYNNNHFLSKLVYRYLYIRINLEGIITYLKSYQ